MTIGMTVKRAEEIKKHSVVKIVENVPAGDSVFDMLIGDIEKDPLNEFNLIWTSAANGLRVQVKKYQLIQVVSEP